MKTIEERKVEIKESTNNSVESSFLSKRLTDSVYYAALIINNYENENT